jgi:hypothetical protein
MIILLLPWQWWKISKLRKITILHCFFPSKLISKCCNFSIQWDRVKGFSALVTRHLKFDLRPFLACHMSKIFLSIRGTCNRPPSNPQNRRGHTPLLATPWCIILMGGSAEKVVTLFNNISQTKNRAFFHWLRPQKGVGDKKLS